MKLLSALAICLATLAAPAYSATIVSVKHLSCTKDLNIWGHGSHCNCPEETRYDARIGFCVIGEPEPVMFSGAIATGLMGIGGESTGFAIRSFKGVKPAQSFELVLNREMARTLYNPETGRDLNGKPFEVVGELIDLPGVETCSRPAIIVDEIHWLD